MGVPFRPSVVPIAGPQFGDTFSRALEGAFGFVQDVAEARRRGAEFETEQRQAELRNRALEQELGIRGRQARLDILRDPTQITAGERKRRLAEFDAEQTGGDQAAAPPGPTPPSPALEAALESARGQVRGDRPPAPGEEPGRPVTPPGGVTPGGPEEAAGFQPPPFIRQPEQVFAPGGQAVRLPDIGVSAQAPEAQVGVPDAAPPTVPDALADALAPQQPKIPRPQFQQFGADPQLGPLFFDPRGGQREAFAAGSFAAEETADLLERAARQQELQGNQRMGDSIRELIPQAVAAISAGNPPNDVVQGIFQQAEEGVEGRAEERFLTGELEELGEGETTTSPGFQAMSLEDRVAELRARRNQLVQLAAVDVRAERQETAAQRRADATLTQQIVQGLRADTRDLVDAANGFSSMQQGFNQLREGNPAGGFSLLSGFARVNDPGSVVRGEELRAVEALGAFDQRIKTALNKARDGTLDIELAGQILAMGRALMEERSLTFQEFRNAAIQRGSIQGLDPEDISGALGPGPFERFSNEAAAAADAETVRELLGDDAFPPPPTRNPGRGRQ